jgi:hypothetical protein
MRGLIIATLVAITLSACGPLVAVNKQYFYYHEPAPRAENTITVPSGITEQFHLKGHSTLENRIPCSTEEK